VQDYTTDFRRKALSLGISLSDRDTLRKYLAGLREDLRKEVTLTPIHDIGEACKRATVFEELNRGRRGNNKQASKQKAQTRSSGGSLNEGGSKKDAGKKERTKLTCEHCKKPGH
jgi:hypothetical protein